MMLVRACILMCVVLAGCSAGAECGVTSDAGGPSLTATVSGESFLYENLTSSPNNDCPAGGNVVSVTVGGSQVGTGFPITLCLPRPDLIGVTPISLAESTLIQLVDVSARGQDGCTYSLVAGSPTGTATFAGFCTKAGAAYHITFSGSVPGTQICYSDAGPGAPVSVTLVLSGTATVQIL